MKTYDYKLVIMLICCIILWTSCTSSKLDESTVVKQQEPRENKTEYSFPATYEKFHEENDINYLLNRLYSSGYAPKEDLIFAGKEITDFKSVLTVMEDMAEKAEDENRYLNAAMYVRAIEFYTSWKDPQKLVLYDKFVDLFYKSIKSDDYEITDVKYGQGSLSSMKLSSETNEKKETIILHAGYDGFKEELYPTMKYLASHGYDVICFDVPWMGRSSEFTDESFSYKWENVVGAILDHYELEEASLVGISFGGWLALRAAAYEPRITKVVASSVSFDVNQYTNVLGQLVARFALKNMKDFTNKQIVAQMEKEPHMAWFYDHLMHITRKDTPLEAAISLSEINEENLSSGRITQDVLIQTGYEDHTIPFKMHNMQVKALTNARSVTPQVFTKETQGQNHCQIGNFGLALDLILDWLDET